MEQKFFVCVKGLIFYHDRFLLVHRSDKARGAHFFWETPGGRLEFGESTEEALLREIAEEVGLKITIMELLSSWHFMKDENTQVIGLTYLCKTDENNVTLSSEHNDFRWIKYEELANLNVYSGINERMNTWNWDEIYAKVDKKLRE